MCAMRILIVVFALALVGVGSSGAVGNEVTFEYFKLSTNEIWLVAVAGLPAWAHAGRLAPVKGEDRLSVAALTTFETVRIGERLKIAWKDNGQRGWPGGLKSGELVPSGMMHE